MKTETLTEQLVVLTQLPKDGFLDYLERATTLYQLLYGERPGTSGLPREVPLPDAFSADEVVAPSVAAANAGAKESEILGPEGVLPRPPMRAPAAGSLREAVYYVLESEEGAASPKRISQLVAAMRNVPVTENLKASVGEILRNRHDPRIRRIATGLYTIEPRRIAA